MIENVSYPRYVGKVNWPNYGVVYTEYRTTNDCYAMERATLGLSLLDKVPNGEITEQNSKLFLESLTWFKGLLNVAGRATYIVGAGRTVSIQIGNHALDMKDKPTSRWIE
ncbi:jg16575 [Pararge aegeria aegeria]|uniref:Jg16575 protein n=1 Tax=Pararge aegeria aegeria TaxID=348720 RepID=A0A8S4R7B9_9NEOP|nr:jg16575 [Pararge aegeria aegeria]